MSEDYEAEFWGTEPEEEEPEEEEPEYESEGVRRFNEEFDAAWHHWDR